MARLRAQVYAAGVAAGIGDAMASSKSPRPDLLESELEDLLRLYAQSEWIEHNVRIHRIRLKLTQKEVAAAMRELGCPTMEQATLSEIERSRRSVSLREALVFSKVLDVPLFWLVLPMWLWQENQLLRDRVIVARRRLAIKKQEIEVALLEQAIIHQEEKLR